MAAHRGVVAQTFTALLALGRDPMPQVVAFDGDRWLGACMVPMLDGEPDWRNGGRWAFNEGAGEVLVMFDGYVGPNDTLRPRDNPHASESLIAFWFDAVLERGAWCQPYHRGDDGTLSFDAWRDLSCATPALAMELAACLRGEHGDRPSVALSSVRPR